MPHLFQALPVNRIPGEVEVTAGPGSAQARPLCPPQLSRRRRQRHVSARFGAHGRPQGLGGAHGHSPSRYHSALGCTRFRSGVTSSVHLRVRVSPSRRKVTPNFSMNWTSKCVYGITDDRGTAESSRCGHGQASRQSGPPTTLCPLPPSDSCGWNVCVPQVSCGRAPL